MAAKSIPPYTSLGQKQEKTCIWTRNAGDELPWALVYNQPRHWLLSTDFTYDDREESIKA